MTTGSEPTPREYLAGELKRLRELAGVSGRELAHRTGMSQSTVSRVEAAARVPSLPEVTAWAHAVDLDEESRQRLVALTEAVYTAAQPFHAAGSIRELQELARDREAGATRVRNFQPTLIPGLLQTAEYARRLMPLVDPGGSPRDHAAAVAARLQRQEALYDADRHFEFLITETALGWLPLPNNALAAQIDRIASIATLDNVTVGVVPYAAFPAAPWHNFIIYDSEDPTVRVELTHASLTISAPHDVATYQRHYDQWQAAAIYDTEARALLTTIAAQRGTPGLANPAATDAD